MALAFDQGRIPGYETMTFFENFQSSRLGEKAIMRFIKRMALPKRLATESDTNT